VQQNDHINKLLNAEKMRVKQVTQELGLLQQELKEDSRARWYRGGCSSNGERRTSQTSACRKRRVLR
jgi:hypothetical protein